MFPLHIFITKWILPTTLNRWNTPTCILAKQNLLCVFLLLLLLLSMFAAVDKIKLKWKKELNYYLMNYFWNIKSTFANQQKWIFVCVCVWVSECVSMFVWVNVWMKLCWKAEQHKRIFFSSFCKIEMTHSLDHGTANKQPKIWRKKNIDKKVSKLKV